MNVSCTICSFLSYTHIVAAVIDDHGSVAQLDMLKRWEKECDAYCSLKTICTSNRQIDNCCEFENHYEKYYENKYDKHCEFCKNYNFCW